jgi:hypothetical protein
MVTPNARNPQLHEHQTNALRARNRPRSRGMVRATSGNDGPKALAEFLNAWREDLSDFLPLDVIEACAEWGVCCGHRNVTPA